MSDLPIYPRGDLDSSKSLMGLLGSYWRDNFQDKEVLARLLQVREAMFEQAHVDRAEAEATVSRHTVPIYHMELWKPIKLRKSMSQDVSLAPVTYGPDKAIYGQSGIPPYDRIFTYGASLVAGTVTVFPLPTEIKHMRMLCNRVTDPTLVMVEGVDFKIDVSSGTITLPIDIFNDPRIKSSGVYDSKGALDTEVTLWAFASDIDKDHIWNNYGYVVSTRSTSSVRYRDFVNGIWDAHVGGSSVDSLREMMAAALDVPVAQEVEVVEQILTGRKRQIITDKRVYTVAQAAVVTVSVGETLQSGDFMVDTLQFIDLLHADDSLQLYSSVRTSTPVTVPLTGLIEFPIYPQAIGQAVQPIYTGPTLAPAYAGGYITPFLPQVFLGTGNPPSLVATGDTFFYPAVPLPQTLVPVPISDYVPNMPTCLGFDRTATPLLPKNFINDTVPVTLTGLPAHNHLELSFDLFIFGEWTGNSGAAQWKLTVDGQVILNTNFSNTPGTFQSFPAALGSGSNPRYTGAILPSASAPIWSCIVTLIPPAPESSNPRDVPYITDLKTQQPSKYRLLFKIAHTAATAAITFEASGLGTGRYAINPTSASLNCGPTFKKSHNSHSGNPITDQPFGPSQIESITFSWDPAVDSYELATARSLKLLMRSNANYTGFATTQLYVGGVRSSAMLYPATWWSLNNITVNAVTSSRVLLPNLPVDQIKAPELAGLSLDSKYITGAYFGALYFANKDVPIEYVPADAQGFVDAKFEITGFPADVDQFWIDVHARGVDQGLTLANYLDKRATPPNQPSASDLPTTINPLMFLLRHIMKHNLIVMKVRRGLEGPDALPNELLSALRFTLPPHMSYIIFTEVVLPSDIYSGPVVSTVHGGSGPVLDTEIANVVVVEPAPTVQAVEGVLI